MKKRSPSPLGAVWRGALAGAAGAALQDVFFRVTARWLPEPTQPPRGEGKPDAARDQNNLQTTARRFTEGLMLRGPLTGEQKARAGVAVHYLYGAMWGAFYGLWRESARAPGAVFGALVWALSDHLILPAFRLAAWPQRYSLKEHQYALEAHFVYGLTTSAAYALLRDVGAVPLAAVPAMVALQARAWALRTPPARLFPRSPVKRAVEPLMQRMALA